MSVWTRVKSKTLDEKVDMKIFETAIATEMELTLDYSVKEIKNSYGKSKVDAMIKNKGNNTALGILRNSKGGIDIVGDTWQSGIQGISDKSHTKLVNMLSQVYQKHKMKKDLELAGWEVKTVKKDNKIVLECTQW